MAHSWRALVADQWLRFVGLTWARSSSLAGRWAGRGTGWAVPRGTIGRALWGSLWGRGKLSPISWHPPWAQPWCASSGLPVSPAQWKSTFESQQKWSQEIAQGRRHLQGRGVAGYEALRRNVTPMSTLCFPDWTALPWNKLHKQKLQGSENKHPQNVQKVKG